MLNLLICGDGCLLFCFWLEFDFFDVCFTSFEYFDIEVVDCEVLADSGNSPERCEYPAPHGVVICFFWEVGSKFIVEIVDVDTGIDDGSTFFGSDDGGFVDFIVFMFITDFAYDFLDDIFDGNESRGSAVLIENDCKLNFILLEFDE